MKFVPLLLLVLLLSSSANAQQGIIQYRNSDTNGTPTYVSPTTPLPSAIVNGPVTPLGYCQLSVAASSVLLSSCSGGIPSGTTIASISVSGTNIRYRDDGPAPTASIGLPILQGQNLPYSGSNLPALKFIAQSGTATLDIGFYMP